MVVPFALAVPETCKIVAGLPASDTPTYVLNYLNL